LFEEGCFNPTKTPFDAVKALGFQSFLVAQLGDETSGKSQLFPENVIVMGHMGFQQSRLNCWLVVWNIWMIFPYIGKNNPN
jgi:hypothetical protein